MESYQFSNLQKPILSFLEPQYQPPPHSDMGKKGKKEMAHGIKFHYDLQPIDKYMRQKWSVTFLQELLTVLMLMLC